MLLALAEVGRLRVAPQRYTLPGINIALIHDIAATPDFYVIAVGPIDFSLPKFVGQYMTSRCSIAECMEYKPHDKPTTVHLVPRPGGKAGEGGGSAKVPNRRQAVLPFVIKLLLTLQGHLL